MENEYVKKCLQLSKNGGANTESKHLPSDYYLQLGLERGSEEERVVIMRNNISQRGYGDTPCSGHWKDISYLYTVDQYVDQFVFDWYHDSSGNAIEAIDATHVIRMPMKDNLHLVMAYLSYFDKMECAQFDDSHWGFELSMDHELIEGSNKELQLIRQKFPTMEYLPYYIEYWLQQWDKFPGECTVVTLFVDREPNR